MFTAFFTFYISFRMVPSRVRISVSFLNTHFKSNLGVINAYSSMSSLCFCRANALSSAM
mgnify:CR=1 FL=1